MFRLLLLICFVHLTVGDEVVGRILLNGDPSLTTSLTAGSKVIIEIRETALMDTAAPLVASAQVSNVTTLPVAYTIKYTPSVPPSSFYSLSARVLCPDTLCYINDGRVPLTVEEGGINSVDISVRAIR